MKNNEEILYIENNQEYINSVIKKHNPNSTIIYLLLNGMHFDSSFKGNYYYLNIDCYRNDYLVCFICLGIQCNYWVDVRLFI